MVRGRGCRRGGDRGQALPLVAVVLLVVFVSVLLVVRASGAVADRTRARAAADGAALAGVRDGRAGAERLAQLNGGRLVDYRSMGLAVEVRVRVGSAEASARAAADVVADPAAVPTPVTAGGDGTSRVGGVP